MDSGNLILLETFGNEITIVNSARVSFGNEITQLTEKDIKLIKYLWKNLKRSLTLTQ